jgi:hypothetical protein
MLKEELAFIKALSGGDIWPDFYKQLMATMGKKKRPSVPDRNRGNTTSQRASATGKRKATELTCATDCSQAATPQPALAQNLDLRVDLRGGRARRPVHAKWTDQAFSQGFGPVRTCCLLRDIPGRMSDDMSGPLSGTPDGSTTTVHEATNFVPAGQSQNKIPIFITGVTDTRDIQTWMRESCPCSLAAQLKAGKVMGVPSTADGFRATVSALRSLDGKGVSFNTLSLQDRCVRLLVKNFGKPTP